MATLMTAREEIPSVEYLPLQAAASWYGVGQTTLYRLLDQGELKRYKRDGDKRTYLRVEELERRFRPRLT